MPATNAKQQAWLVAGLGNPGPEYERTPHNLGFFAVDRLAARHAIRVTRKEANSLVGLGEVKGQPVVLVKPQTYMNVSGPAVKMLLDKYELPLSQLLLVYDELALPWGQLRIRPKGSSAGHNGVKSVIRSAGTEEFARLRLGIHPGHPLGDSAKFVLEPMGKPQGKELDEMLDRAADAIESTLARGVEKAMAIYNVSLRPRL
ncbi:MAG: aminoacyl-tRNA hydrolase [Acidobacteria bacterium]|nr:aminoacyl-tRNA hydrolase [Acidobacteriota bacterium]